MTDYIIGPGVMQAMADAQDEPRSNEMYVVTEPGHQISTTYGRDAVYTWIQEDNKTSRSPFGG